MKAIILAGGIGTRLRPLTSTCPKPLLPVGNVPLISRLVLALRRQNIREFVFLLHYKPEMFKQALGSGKAFDAVFEYECLAEDLSTAGSVKFIGEKITATTLVYSADILAEVAVESMLRFHRERNALVTLALQAMPAPLPFGIVLRGQSGRITRFLEKPTWPQVYGDWINASIYIIEPELIKHIPDHGQPSFFEKEVFPPLAQKGEAIYGFPLSGYWRDVGTPRDLREANLDLLRGRLPSSMLTEAERNLAERNFNAPFWAEPSTKIDPAAVVHDTVIGKNCRIKSGAKIFRSIVGDDVKIKNDAHLDGAVIMKDASIGAAAILEEDALIGAGAKLGPAVFVQKNGAVRPGKKIGAQKVVKAVKALPSGYIRRFVDGGSLLGSGAQNFTCDFMRWVGKAFAQHQRNTRAAAAPMQKILLATADREAFEFWLAPLLEGLCDAGMESYLLQNVTLPVTRRALQRERFGGGIFVGLDDFSGLLRVVLLHSSGENFSTAETCALERIDTFEEVRSGARRDLNENAVREDYLNAMFGALRARNLFAGHGKIQLGVVGAASEIIAKAFFARLQSRVEIITLPLENDGDFRARTLNFQQSLSQARSDSGGFAFLLGSMGERLKLLLPDMEEGAFGVSDIAIAHLLAKQREPARNLLEGWLMPEIFPKRTLGQKAPATKISGMNSSMAALAREQGYDLWYGFDGNGGITVSEWLSYHDALMALAHVLPFLTEDNCGFCRALVNNYSNAYHLIPCPDEAKAQVMRRLIESIDAASCEVHDGVKFRQASGWVLVRLCAGREALEVFKYESRGYGYEEGRSPVSLLDQTIRARLAGWIAEIKNRA